MRSSSWTAIDTKDNATATATRAAPGTDAESNFVTGIAASFNATISGKTLELKDGTTTIAKWHVYDHLEIAFPHAIHITPGTAVSAVLAASGSGGTSGTVTLMGYVG